MRGLSLRGLEDSLEKAVSYSALFKYENGDAMASSEVIRKIARALQLPLDFFFRTYSVKLERVRFRKKKSKLSTNEETAILEEAREFFERYFEVEEVVNDRRRYQPIVAEPSEEGTSDSEALAEKVRLAWDLGTAPISNVHELLETRGIKVCLVNPSHDDFDGCSAGTSEGPVVVLRNTPNIPRRRMTAVHEWAHIIAEPLKMDEQDEERFVGKLAGAIMLPKEPFMDMFGGRRKNLSVGELVDIKVHFGASISSIIMRAKDLNLIDSAQSTEFWKRFGSKWKKEKKEPGDEKLEGGELHSRFPRLVNRAVAENLITPSQGAAYRRLGLEEFQQQFNLP